MSASGAATATLDQLIFEARDAQKRLTAITGESSSVNITAMLASDTRMVQIKHCTHCNKDRHTKAECHDLHPDLKAKWIKERIKGNGNGNKGKGKGKGKGDKGGDKGTDKPPSKKRKAEEDEE